MESVRVDAGNVAAEHEHDAELAHGVQKAEHDGGEKRAARERNQDARDEAHGTGAEKARRIDERRCRPRRNRRPAAARQRAGCR